MASFPMEGWTPPEFLEEVQRLSPLTPVLIHDPSGTPEDAFRLGSLGASHFFVGNLDLERLSEQLETALEESRCQPFGAPGRNPGGEPWVRLLVGDSRAIRGVLEVIRLVAARRCTILITGETGTGKEVAARALHLAGPRAQRPLVTVNCSALPETLLEAELFGHVRGAFTGAVSSRIGRLEQADGGTLLLDEIGDMPLDLQVKLLRAIQEREFQRLGSSETVRVDIRVVAASNSDLLEKVRQGRFREDLYYRLNVVPLVMPPLRERPEDIPLLVRHFVQKICASENLAVKQVHPESLDRLSRYSFPGNVRQLENAVEMAVALSGRREILSPADFPIPSGNLHKPAPASAPASVAVPETGLDFERTVGAFEWSILEQAMRKAGGNKKRAADMLRLKRTTLSAKLRSMEARAARAR
jgi:DNA-binding NtrC family response regulator